MKNQWLLLTIGLLIRQFCYSQDSIVSQYPDYPKLRVNIEWMDSIQRFYDSSEMSTDCIYRFKIRGIEAGIAPKREVLVSVNQRQLKKFNPLLSLNKRYWWILCKTEQTVNDETVYRVCGAF